MTEASVPLTSPSSTSAHPTVTRRLLESIEENALAVIVLGSFTLLMLLALGPHLMVIDGWMTLVAGREVATVGIPDRDTIAVLTHGAQWTDQQWLGQLVLYLGWRIGDLGLTVVSTTAAVIGAYTLTLVGARRRGATPLAWSVVFGLAVFAAPWSWQVRAQTLALPLFAAVTWLLVEARDGVSRRTFVVWPLLVVWANIHGSVVLGVGLTVALALTQLVRRRATAATALLAGVACLTPFATPYSPGRILDYYRLFLVDRPFAGIVREWERTGLEVITVVFWALALLAVVTVALRWRRLSAFELVVLAITLVGAVQALRGIVWFVLACMLVLPAALTRTTGRTAPVRRGPNRVIAAVMLVLVLGGVGFALVRTDERVARATSLEGLAAVRAATADRGVTVWAANGVADWLLWSAPDLRGRVSSDARFELLTPDQFDAIVAWTRQTGRSWDAVTRPYHVIVLDEDASEKRLRMLAAEPGTRIVFHDDWMTVALRRP